MDGFPGDAGDAAVSAARARSVPASLLRRSAAADAADAVKFYCAFNAIALHYSSQPAGQPAGGRAGQHPGALRHALSAWASCNV